jgi:hypothetical protein
MFKISISFHICAALYQGEIFYQNDSIHVKLDPKSADISFLNDKA